MRRSRAHSTERRFPQCRGLAFALTALVMIGPGSLAALGKSSEPQKFDLLGTWYIVVHYRDTTVGSADGEQWEDKVWTFDYRGSRLLWTEYPVVLFDDDRGRQELLASGRSIRSAGAWQPNAAQLEEIATGLAVNPQWTRSKSLRGDPTSGFRSSGTLNQTSASVIGYSETWEIEDPVKQPIFRRIDQMSSARSVPLDGITEYRSAAGISVDPAVPRRLSGSFSRDGVQTGSFIMLRSGSIKFANPKETQKKWK
ncbi:MAG: hypothetical protein IH973_12230 [Myxococcales bacterium]|nr:hypothetical protein [Myxococcales bacterium]